ncbi:MAG: hypothetical protein N2378_07640 [Chloroflexaceae bacterium]|nr:hypothetical protein [Chloroflexaceae bacterium]
MVEKPLAAFQSGGALGHPLLQFGIQPSQLLFYLFARRNVFEHHCQFIVRQWNGAHRKGAGDHPLIAVGHFEGERLPRAHNFSVGPGHTLFAQPGEVLIEGSADNVRRFHPGHLLNHRVCRHHAQRSIVVTIFQPVDMHPQAEMFKNRPVTRQFGPQCIVFHAERLE